MMVALEILQMLKISELPKIVSSLPIFYGIKMNTANGKPITKKKLRQCENMSMDCDSVL